jgi:hypothetical protein
MKNRILTIALALSLLATVFVAFPTTAAYDYTGSLVTTDDDGVLKSTYVQGEPVYVNVETRYHGDLSAEDIYVVLETTGGSQYSWFYEYTDDPVVGWYNSSEATAGVHTLNTGHWINGEEVIYYVIAYETSDWTELGRTTIVVMAAGLTVDPDPVYISGYGSVGYYPGQTLTVTLVTTHMTDMFYVQIVNETDVTVQNWTAQIAPAGFWTADWTIPAAIADGVYRIQVRDSGTHGIWNTYFLEIQKYWFNIEPQRGNYLPGETAKMDYFTLDIATLGDELGVSITFAARWWNTTDAAQWLNGTLPGSKGTQELPIPATDIATWQGVEIFYWANETGRCSEAYIWLDLDQLSANMYLNNNWFYSGEMVAVTVEANVGGDAIEGAQVDIYVRNNASVLAAYSTPTTLLTGPDGTVTHTFVLVDNADTGIYTVDATVTMLGFSTVAAQTLTVSDWGGLSMTFNKYTYMPGETVVMTFLPTWNGVEVTVPIIAYNVWTDDGLLLVGNTTTLSAEFAIPEEYSDGWIWAYATGYFEGNSLTSYAEAWVEEAALLLVSDVDSYRPGDTITWTWEIVGPVESGTLSYRVYDYWGIIVLSESPEFATSGSFSVDVPETDAGWGYYAVMYASSTTGFYDEAWANAYMVDDNELRVWVEKSGYFDGSFKPGQTVKIHYEIGVYWYDPLPMYGIWVGCDFDPIGVMFFVTETDGVIEYTLPDDSPAGFLGLNVELWDPVADDELSDDVATVTVNTQLSGWDKSVAGMAAIDFTVLVLLVVMILLLIIVPFLKARPPKAAASEVPPPVESPKP